MGRDQSASEDRRQAWGWKMPTGQVLPEGVADDDLAFNDMRNVLLDLTERCGVIGWGLRV